MNVQGVDLSYCQPKVDFEKLKEQGYKFVILRAGYGSALKYPNQYDPTFEDHYRNARAAGLGIGAYWYSYADSADAAKDEAKAFIKALGGKLFEYPVYMDLEERSQFYRGKAFCDSIVTAFCSELENAGYFAGVYCSTYWYTNFVSESVRSRYACWIADYAPRCSYTGQYGIWQNGLVTAEGIGSIDHDFCYTDYPSVIKASGRNGFPKPEQPSAKPPAKKTVDEIAREVIEGKWGAGAERKKLLAAAGYNYDVIQQRVNELLGIKPPNKKKSITEIAKEVIEGKWGAGAERMRLLTDAGYDYMQVQNKVNELLSHNKRSL